MPAAAARVFDRQVGWIQLAVGGEQSQGFLVRHLSQGLKRGFTDDRLRTATKTSGRYMIRAILSPSPDPSQLLASNEAGLLEPESKTLFLWIDTGDTLEIHLTPDAGM